MADEIDDGAWFLPKRYGYGAGLPVAWQGWALLGGYTAIVFVLTWGIVAGDIAMKVVSISLFALATALLVEVTRRHTRGGWRWRWGKDD